MTRGLRWRVVVLQVGLMTLLGFLAGFFFWGSSFSHGQVNDQLSAQKITFPAANDKSIAALPAADATAMRQYAGQQLTTGDQAKVYADSFINVHLNEMAGGQTYAQLSAASQASPSNTKLAGEVATVFKGTSLRGMLLDAYGWWTLGTVVFYAGITMLVSTMVVALTLVFELVRWSQASRKPRVVEVVSSDAQKVAA
jgi:hypothetical protein